MLPDFLDLLDKETQLKRIEACNQLGFIYERGIGTKVDKKKAKDLFKYSSDQNDAIGQYRLNRITGDLFELTKSCLQGFTKAIMSFGFEFGQKKIGSVDFENYLVILLYSLAAEKNDAHGNGNLGRLYENG